MSEKSEQQMLDKIAENADIDQSTVQSAYASDQTGLRQIFTIVAREAEKITESAVIFGLSAPATGILVATNHPVWAGITGLFSIVSAASYHMGAKGLDTARQTILARFSAPKSPANG